MSTQDPGFVQALSEAQKSAEAGGVPIGACLVAADGTILGSGHNERVQSGSAILHAEISALNTSGRLPASRYAGATMYTTLAPCDMCTGACLLYKLARVVVGEDQTFCGEGIRYLRQRGVDVVVLDDQECKALMERFKRENPRVWAEDIGEEIPK